VEPQHTAVFDELYDLVHRGKALSQSVVERLTPSTASCGRG
jgi:hypothetical protein